MFIFVPNCLWQSEKYCRSGADDFQFCRWELLWSAFCSGSSVGEMVKRPASARVKRPASALKLPSGSHWTWQLLVAKTTEVCGIQIGVSGNNRMWPLLSQKYRPWHLMSGNTLSSAVARSMTFLKEMSTTFFSGFELVKSQVRLGSWRAMATYRYPEVVIRTSLDRKTRTSGCQDVMNVIGTPPHPKPNPTWSLVSAYACKWTWTCSMNLIWTVPHPTPPLCV